MPALDGPALVEHRYVELGDGVTIHVAESGPSDGPAVMLVHGFPQNWWEWHDMIGPLAADGYRVLCPDLRGAGWSSAPRSRYTKNEMADDLAGVLDRMGVEKVKLVAHDWGGPVAVGATGHLDVEALVLADILKRDERDQNRAVAPLKPAADAYLLDNSHLDIEGGVRAAIDIVEAVRAGRQRV